MNNVAMEVKGDKLIMTVDLSKAGAISKSGKTTIIAGTGGFVPTGHANGSKVSVNVTVPKE
jgi:hypothetical protein